MTPRAPARGPGSGRRAALVEMEAATEVEVSRALVQSRSFRGLCRHCARPGLLTPFVAQTMGIDLALADRPGLGTGENVAFPVQSYTTCLPERLPSGHHEARGEILQQVLHMDPEMRDALSRGPAPGEVMTRARQGGLPDFPRLALHAILSGRAPLEAWETLPKRPP